MEKIVFIDTEVGFYGNEVLDLGAVKEDGSEFHGKSFEAFTSFLSGQDYICGHNILRHDLEYLQKPIRMSRVSKFIDTLFFSPLLFPKKPYHKLVKDDKICTDEFNNPLNDAKKAKDLLFDEITAFNELDERLKQIFFTLLGGVYEFKDFFDIIEKIKPTQKIDALIHNFFSGMICFNSPLLQMARELPVELAYALSIIDVIKYDSISPPWILKNYPKVESVLHELRGKRCSKLCKYCAEELDEKKALKKYFHYDSFRLYEGKPLQHDAVVAALNHESLLTIFPTGGGKSITFQLPALIAGESENGLTVIISPLQSLMKDQVDNLEQNGIVEAVTINGLLDPLERSVAFKRVEDGSASLLYLSPESLRSRSIEGLLIKRNVVRFVIDEAHCFSSWGQDFRVDYLYIGDFIKQLQEKKNMNHNIPVSCFTATAKKKVIQDIEEYFKEKLSINLKVFSASAGRTNLKYHVFNENSDDDKYLKLRQLIIANNIPTIIYVSRTKETKVLSERLSNDGYEAVAYHGKMDKQEKVYNQDLFMKGEVQIIVATTAFGMGVDKKDVGMVVHYDISDSLENYVQEAGRAGRDEKIEADCYVLFNDEDLNKHFTLLNQTKLSLKEIQQVWKAIKDLTKFRSKFSQSALEIARQSGWDDTVNDMETRVKTAINALEQSGFLKRGQNMPRIFANSIIVKNMEEARTKIDASSRFDDKSREWAIRIIGNLISAKSRTMGSEDEAESRVDYISDKLGIVKEDVIRTINLLREEQILADNKDLTAFIKRTEHSNRSLDILNLHKEVEWFLLKHLEDGEQTWNLKEVNESLQNEYPALGMSQIKTIINYWSIKHIVKRTQESNKNYITLRPYFLVEEVKIKVQKRDFLADFIIVYLYSKVNRNTIKQSGEEIIVEFSALEIKDEFEHNLVNDKTNLQEIEDVLFYLLKIGALKIEGAFVVMYNAMQIERLETDNKARYKKDDYSKLEEFYKNKMQQIHIVGEYATRMVDDYQKAMSFVDDYFTINYDEFLSKYFRGRRDEIDNNVTPKKFKKLFGELSPAQLSIIKDSSSNHIVVAAGPGSGKTRLLAHKLASLYMMEDVKHEQMLMLTFSRAAVTEFKKRLMGLIGNAANFVSIMTFHSYCFDLLGKVGNLEKSDVIIEQTVEKIIKGDVDPARITKTVLVIDEAQDMNEAEFSLVKALIDKNEEMRVIAVGDDDQNIYEFRGSSSKHLESLITDYHAKKYELVDNYRSKNNIVELANSFAKKISHRLKSTPIHARDRSNGSVKVCQHVSACLAIPVVNDIIKDKYEGTTCVLTRTNDEALAIMGFFGKKNISANLIQTNSGFNLYNLMELRDFLGEFNLDNSNYIISDEIWKKAKNTITKKYHRSSNLKGTLKLLKDFEDTNGKTKYISDFEQFIRESKIEDFFIISDATVMVSTIHQAKGREFDNVYLALSRYKEIDNSMLRIVYVAMTRAKKNLHIHYNGDYFESIYCNDVDKSCIAEIFDSPPELILQLSHKDVNLGIFEDAQNEINNLMSGDELDVSAYGCLVKNKYVLKFSNKFIEKIERLEYTGHFPKKAVVKNIVYWKNKDDDIELKIILPNIHFEKKF